MERYKFLVWSHNNIYLFTENNLIIICFAGSGQKNCRKINCDRSETATQFELQVDWDCNGKLTTKTTITDKNGQEHKIENASNCHGSHQCQMPDCPAPVPCPCQAGSKVIQLINVLTY